VDEKRARLNCIHYLLGLVPYQEVPRDPIELPERQRQRQRQRQRHEDYFRTPCQPG
jgi:hypothetical protein